MSKINTLLSYLDLHPHKNFTNYFPDWPNQPSAILQKIKALNFSPKATLGTTIVPRKLHWEATQLLKLQGKLPSGISQTDWIQNDKYFISSLKFLSNLGIKRGRLAVYPYELTQDGYTFNWQPLDRAIDLMNKNHLQVELVLGPLHYPYDPGIRLPEHLRQLLVDEYSSQKPLTLSIRPNPQALVSSVSIRDYSISFLTSLLNRYQNHRAISRFYLGNESHNIQGIENTRINLKVDSDLQSQYLAITRALTNKPIAINTNIHSSKPQNIVTTYGEWLYQLHYQGVLGLDVYPTRELESFLLRHHICNYSSHINHLRQLFPHTKIAFTEFQAEPWPPGKFAGQSWSQIFSHSPEIITKFYQIYFPPTLETHLLSSQVEDIDLWGAPAYQVLSQMGYTFPAKIIEALAKAMRQP